MAVLGEGVARAGMRDFYDIERDSLRQAPVCAFSCLSQMGFKAELCGRSFLDIDMPIVMKEHGSGAGAYGGTFMGFDLLFTG